MPRGDIAAASCAVTAQDAAASALLHLWRTLALGPDPLLFLGERYAMHLHHAHGFLARASSLKRETTRVPESQLLSWMRLAPPEAAPGLAEAPLAGQLLKQNALNTASLSDRRTVPGPQAGWLRYDFEAGWTALSVMLSPTDERESTTITALPEGRQDDWLAFLEGLRAMHALAQALERPWLSEMDRSQVLRFLHFLQQAGATPNLPPAREQ